MYKAKPSPEHPFEVLHPHSSAWSPLRGFWRLGSLCVLLGVLLAAVAFSACGDISPPVEEGGDAATSTPRRSFASQISVDEYAAMCAESASDEIAEDATYGEISAEMTQGVERLQAVIPPDEVTDWHNESLEYAKSIKALADSQPKDDVASPFLFLTLLPQLEELERTKNNIAPDVLVRLVADGCIEEVRIPIQVGGRVEGAVDEPGEADTYFFQAKGEATYLIEATWETLPSIRLEITDFRTFSRVRESGRQPYLVSWTAPESGEYYLVVSSGDDSGEGTGSYTVSIRVEMLLLPRSGVRYAPEGSAIRINWDAVDGADHYNVYHGNLFDSSCIAGEGGETSFCKDLALKVTETTYLHTEPDSKTNYYWVAACNSQGCSEVDTSTPATAVAPEVAVPPPIPAATATPVPTSMATPTATSTPVPAATPATSPMPGPTATPSTTPGSTSRPESPTNVRYALDGSTMGVSWDAVDGANYYNVYYDDFDDSNCRLGRDGRAIFCEELATNVAETTYVHASPESAENYYWVAACNSSGCSEIDSESPASPIEARPSGPTNVGYALEGSPIHVRWDAVDGADYYNVYYDDFFDSSCRLGWDGRASFCEELATNVAETTYVHTIPGDDENYYWVVACNRGGCSDIDSEDPARRIEAEPTGTTSASTPSGDRAVLVALYNAMDGENWRIDWNWLSEEPINRWYGVTTDSTGLVTHLSLDSNELTGNIPAELGSLSNLVMLDLSHNRLSGEMPPELGNLSSLQELLLRSEQGQPTDGKWLSGEIPAELGNLTNLQSLDLTDNKLNGEISSELGSLTNLERLSLRGNQLTGSIPAEMGGLSNLGHLRLNHNRLSGEIPAELGMLTNLRTLALYNNQLSGEIPAELGDLAKLFQLGLSNNRLRGNIPPELGNLSNLHWLYLFGNQLNGEIPSALGALANLERLQAQGNQLSGAIPPELGHLAELRILALHNNQLSGEIPGSLGGLTNLERMFLHENQLSGAMPPELGNLTNLKVLALHDNQLSGELPDTLIGLINLIAITVCEANQLSCDIAGVVAEGVAVGVEAVFGVGGVVGNTAGVVGGVVGDVGGVLGDVVGGLFGGWW